MTTPLDQVTVDARCLSQACEKQGCALALEGTPKPFHLIDMDHPESPAKGSRCDYLLVGADGNSAFDLYVAPLELKSSGFRAISVSKQLAGGARVAERIVPKARCRFVPVVAHAGAHRRQIDALAACRVPFRRRTHAIELVRCGAGVADVLA